MNISQDGVDLIKRWETLRLVAYEDVVGVWTIGYGHTGGVNPGDVISEEDAEMLLRNDLTWVEDEINEYVDIDLEQHEFDALASLVYNIGGTAFRGSTLRRLLNSDNKPAAALQFPRWDKANGVVVRGLSLRRSAEKRMFEGLA